jgi:hypothetical protein
MTLLPPMVQTRTMLGIQLHPPTRYEPDNSTIFDDDFVDTDSDMDFDQEDEDVEYESADEDDNEETADEDEETTENDDNILL